MNSQVLFLQKSCDFIKKKKVKPSDRGDIKVPRSSATLFSSRAHHGATSDFVQTLTTDELKAADRSAALGTTRDRLMAKSMLNTAARRFSELPYSSDLTPVSVPERGYKCRVVTKSDPRLICRAHEERSRLWRILLRIPQISRNLGAIPRVIRVARTGILVSTDMSQATDALSHKALSWICLEFNIDSRLLYEFSVVEPGKDRVPYLRGCPMGTPVSWAVLSLLHYMILRTVTGNKYFAICGDDAIARMDMLTFNWYKDMLFSVGLELNLSKTFLSDSYGTFCEGYYKASKGDRGLLSRLPAVPTRVFNPSESDWTSNIQQIFKEYVNLGVSLRKLNRATKVAFPHVYYMCRNYQVNPYLPTFLGGVGLPPPRDDCYLTVEEKAVYRWVCTHGTSFPIPNSMTGNHLKLLQPKLSAIKYSTSTIDPCPHVERVITDLTMAAEIADVSDGSRTERKFSMATVIRSMSRRYRLLPRAWGGDLRLTKIIDVWNMELKASRASVRSATGHSCDGLSNGHNRLLRMEQRFADAGRKT